MRCLLLITTLLFTCGEKICSSIRLSQNIMNIVVETKVNAVFRLCLTLCLCLSHEDKIGTLRLHCFYPYFHIMRDGFITH